MGIIYVRRCPVCGRTFESRELHDMIPPHSIPVYQEQPCTGAGHQGELVEQRTIMGRWYSARLLYESVHDPPEKPSRWYPLFEESIIVFYVKDEDSIHSRVLALARAKEDHYTAGAGNEVYWTFREILEVQEIMSDSEQIEDGTEVFFRWWHNPGPRAFKTMRETHQGRAWWLDSD